ncbi:MAG: MarR family transcriptional regulator, partial [Proteobacteria bacterium]|nr:MarR family transcriptional regulator [Pseudomonadota bacterium]
LTRKIEEIEVRTLEESELSDLTRKQVYYLDVIAQLQNPTPTELAQALQLSKPSITAIMDKMIQSGYILRVQSDEDKRSAHVHLTEKGKKVAELHDHVHTTIAGYLTKPLDRSEIERLTELFNKIVD